MIASFLRANRAWLNALNFRLAALFGAPKGMSLSGFAWKLEQEGSKWGIFWRQRIDTFFMKVFGQHDHCRKAYERDSAQGVANG